MALVKVKEKAQITLPAKIRQALGIKEGDYLEADISGGQVVLTPQVLISKSAAITLSDKGEKMLQEALADVAMGNTKEHESAESLIAELHDEANSD